MPKIKWDGAEGPTIHNFLQIDSRKPEKKRSEKIYLFINKTRSNVNLNVFIFKKLFFLKVFKN